MLKATRTLLLTATLLFTAQSWSWGSETGSSSASAQGHHAKMDMSKMDTPEMRQKMAQMHEQMATCLKSDKSMNDCHHDMMKNCPMMKNGKCEMHGMMGMMGMMGDDHHGMMKGKKSAQKK